MDKGTGIHTKHPHAPPGTGSSIAAHGIKKDHTLGVALLVVPAGPHHVHPSPPDMAMLTSWTPALPSPSAFVCTDPFLWNAFLYLLPFQAPD